MIEMTAKAQPTSVPPHHPGTAEEGKWASEPERLDVTVVLPCYNEQDHVLDEVERITAAMDAGGYRYELLAIDDASIDDTLRLLQEAQLRYPASCCRCPVTAVRGPPGASAPSGPRRHRRVDRRRHDLRTSGSLSWSTCRPGPANDQVVGGPAREQGTHKVPGVPAKWVIRKIAERLTGTVSDLNSGLVRVPPGGGVAVSALAAPGLRA